MSEEDLRIKQIQMKIKGLTFEQSRDISQLCSEYYIEGLEQSRFDKNMLELENTQLKEELKDKNNYHEEASKWYKEAFDTTQENIKLKSVLKEIREYIKGNDDFYYGDELYESYEKILEIIDKGSENND